jgi:hypothetical protein
MKNSKSKGLAASSSDVKLQSNQSHAITTRTFQFGLTKQAKEKEREKLKKEKQGPVDWSHLGIKLKYRGEHERENAWLEWKKNDPEALSTLFKPILKIERHPIVERFWHCLRLENVNSNERTRSRLLMKKFVLDVQEIWLSNLEHLKEHNPKVSLTEDEVEEQNYSRGEGLAYRRDVKGIKTYQHQIQSVSQKRIFTKAFHTAKIPKVTVMLDYVSQETTQIQSVKPLVPKLLNLLSLVTVVFIDGNYRFVDSSASVPNSFSLYIDRMIPSNDFSKITDKCWWRLSLIDSSDLRRRLFVISENDVASFVAKIVSNSNSRHFEMPLEEVYVSEELHDIPYEDGRCEWKARIKILLMQIPAGVQCIFLAELLPSHLVPFTADEYPTSMSVYTSPLEMREILHQPSLPLFDLDFWRDGNRTNDTWIPLLKRLILNYEISLQNYKLPSSLSFASSYSQPEFSDCLSNIQAAGCMQELLSCMIFDSAGFGELPVPNFSDPVCGTLSLAEISSHLSDEVVQAGDLIAACQRFFIRGLWEELLEFGPNLSFMCNRLASKYLEVPGGCEIGRKGIWMRDHLILDVQKQKSQAAANFYRDCDHSSSDSIFVNCNLALDLSLLFPPLIAWEQFSHNPPVAVADDPPELIPFISLRNGINCLQHLVSPIEKRLTATVIIFSSVAVEGVDYFHVLSPGFRRYVPTKNIHGFREQIEVSLLRINPVNNAIVFGITRTGAIPNDLKTNGRNIWHSSVVINENINRPRTPKDYQYIILNVSDCGPNIPTSYTTRMKSNEMVGLTSSAFKNYEDLYKKINELHSVFNRQLALDSKITQIEV